MVLVEVPAGRDVEAGRVERFLGLVDDPSAPRVLHLVGEAGIGKTHLWWWVVGEARRRGFVVLTCRPTGGGLAYEGVEDLLAPLAPAQSAPIPGTPLAVADRHLATVRAASAAGPVLLAVDDWPQLDAESRRLLQSAPRRLADLPVLIAVTTRRPQGARPDHVAEASAAAPSPESSDVVVVGPLPDAVLEHVLSRRTAGSLPRHVLRRLVKVAGGNPTVAVELAAALERRETWVDLNGLAGVPQPLLAVAEQQLTAMPPPLREVLEVVAEAGTVRADALSGMVQGGSDSVDRAFDEGVLRVAGGRIIPASPLLASHARAGLSSARRRLIHRQLAGNAHGIEERAVHLALAAAAPDGDVAAALSDAALNARARGAADAAAEFADTALRLTPAGDPRRTERLFAAVDQWQEAGDLERARRVAHDGLAEHEVCPLPPTVPPLGASGVTAELLRRLARADALLAGFRQSAQYLREAVEHLDQDPMPDDADAAAYAQLRTRTLVDYTLLLSQYDVLAAWETAQALIPTTPAAGSPELLDEAREAHAHVALMWCAGEAGRRQLEVDLDRAMSEPPEDDRAAPGAGAPRHPLPARAQRSTPVHVGPLPRLIYRELHAARRLRVAGHLEAARRLLAVLRRDLEQEDGEGALAPVLLQASEVECLAGRLDAADALRSLAADVVARASQHGSVPHLHYVNALAAALRNHQDEAAAEAREARAGGAELRDERHVIRGGRVLGMLALADRNWSGGLEVLVPALRSADDIGYREPGMFRIHADAVEALCGVGDLAAARELVALLDARAHLPWAHAAAAHATSLVLAADRSMDDAAEQAMRAAREFDALAHPSDAARALVQLASIKRRQRRRADARRILDRAALLLDTHGIRLWNARLQAERTLLGHLNEDDEDLTPAERRTALAVSRGLTNRQVASDLNVSIKTVEAQLTRIYDKLGVHSRSQLVAILLRRES